MRGEVVDARTGEPVEAFEVVIGHDWGNGRMVYNQHSRTRHTDGTFDVSSRVGRGGERVPHVRVEAFGYRPGSSGPITRGGEHVLRIKLEPAADTAGVVSNPDGSRASGVSVAALRTGSQATVSDGRRIGDEPYVTTDTDGRFKIVPQDQAFWLLAVGEEGWAYEKTSPQAFGGEEGFELRLRPFARAEGRWPAEAAGGLWANFAFRHPKVGVEPLVLWFSTPEASEEGRFRFDRLPDTQARPYILSLRDGSDVGAGAGAGEELWLSTAPDLRPGQTTRLPFGGGSVRGRVTGVDPGDRTGVSFTKIVDMPAGEAPEDFDEAVRLFGLEATGSLSADGSFEVSGLVPGEYTFEAFAWRDTEKLSHAGRVVVEDGSVDLGVLEVSPATPAEVGGQAPDVLGRDFDDTPVATGEFAGRWVVGAVWDSCTGRATLFLPTLDAVAGAYADDARVAFLSLNTDRISCGTSGVPVRPATLDNPAWRAGYVSLADGDVWTALGVRHEQPVHLFVLDPQGRFAAIAVAPDELEATLAGLIGRGGDH